MQSIHPQLSSRRSWSFGGPTVLCAVGSAVVVERRGRAQFVSGLVVIGAIWQVVAVKEATLINTTAVPLAGPIVGGLVVLAAIVWSRAKNAAEA